MEDHDYDEITTPDVPLHEDSGIDGEVSSLESVDATITPDKSGSECGSDDGNKTETAFLDELIDAMGVIAESQLEKATGNLKDFNVEPVEVLDRDGKPMVLQMPPQAPVGDILRRAAHDDDVPDADMYRFRLMHGDRVLDQGKTLAEQRVPRGSVLRLEDEMELKMTRLDGNTFKVRAYPSTNVADFRRTLQTHTGIQPAEVRILFAGKTLADGMKLSDYKVKNGSAMQVVTRTHSG